VAGVDETVAAIKSGQPVVLPTDTVYGLCAYPFREEPVRRLYRLKGRPDTQPTALLAADVELFLDAFPELPARAAAAARALFPGPYTLVAPNEGRRYPWVTGSNERSIGVRVPAVVGPGREVLEQVGCLAATSANRPGEPDPRRVDDVPEAIRAGCGAVLDGGELPGTPSTVVDITGPEPRILREGAVSVEEALARVRTAVG
jgi:L-threonylcarbamoyladenylate synthase